MQKSNSFIDTNQYHLQYPLSYVNLLFFLVYPVYNDHDSVIHKWHKFPDPKTSIPVNVHLPSLPSATNNLFQDCINSLNLLIVLILLIT